MFFKAILFFPLIGSIAVAKVKTEPFHLKFNNVSYLGDLYFSDEGPAKSPAILLTHEFWGKGEFEERHARKLAELGYLVLAADLYGSGRHSKKTKDADAFVKTAEGKGMENLYKLFDTYVAELAKHKRVD